MKKLYLFLTAIVMVLNTSIVFSQNVAINTSGTAADANAILDVSSANKGVLIPRLDFVNRPTVGVTTGMLIYVVTNGPDGNNSFYYYDGTQWLKVRNRNDQQNLSLGHDTLFLSQGNYVLLGSVFTSQGYIKCGTNYINPSADNNNCGSCGAVCPSGKVCSNGACVTTCLAGFTLCLGSCINASTDINNCGSCGHACQPGQVCSAGACVVSCQIGLTNCSGICINSSSDNSNCGSCGLVCSAGKVCAGGVCVLSCQAGLTNCAGTCTNLSSSNNNCGSCGTLCPAGKACSNGACITTCQAGLTNCAGSCANLTNDNNNCGSCGHPCAAGHGCLNGVCQ